LILPHTNIKVNTQSQIQPNMLLTEAEITNSSLNKNLIFIYTTPLLVLSTTFPRRELAAVARFC